MKKILPFLVLLLLALAACQSTPPSSTPASEPPASEPVQPSEEPSVQPSEEPSVQPPDQPGTEVLPPDPVKVEFQASDGQALSGYYYPAAVNPAPVVVLMHWVAGDMSDWYEIAPWLQNRSLANPFPNPGTQPWWDPTWFPPMPSGASYGVFIFSFRGCLPMDQRGCETINEEGWMLDAEAALLTAAALEGVDPTKVVAIGSSIGADGAADGCLLVNLRHPGACQGALSLSPGGYLDMPYLPAVQQLGNYLPPAAAWCLADENEYGLCEAVAQLGIPGFQSFRIPSGGHGNKLLSPNLDPLPMQIILDFLAAVVGP